MTLTCMRRFTSALYLSLVFAITAPLVPAQSSLQRDGRVTDPDKSGVAGATVTLIARDNRSRATVTTAGDGSFRFERVAAGDYLIEVRASGFAKSVKAVSIKSVNERLDIALDVAALNDGVVVTASGTAQSVDEVSKAVTVIDARQIELRDEYSVLETLRAAPGVRVVQQGGPGAFASVRIRGLRSFDTGVLVDGLRFRDAADTQGSANGFISELNVVSLERVEVLRGSGSSLYGSNAIGGVVNLVTVAGGGMDDRLFYSAGLSQLKVTGGVDGDDRARQTSLQGVLGYHFTPSVTLSGRVFANDAFAALNEDPMVAPGFAPPPSGALVRAIPLNLDEQRRVEARGVPLTPDNYNRGDANFIPGLNDPDNRRKSDFFSGALNFTQRLNDRASYRLSYHRVDVNRSFLDGPRGIGAFGEPAFTSISDFAGDVDTFTSRVDLRLGGANLLTTGYEFERESYGDFSTDESPAPPRGSLDIWQRSHTFFAQNQTRLLADRLQLSLAFRLQGFDLSAPRFTGGAPRYVGVSFDAPPNAYTGDGSAAYLFRATNTKLRAHVGNGYRGPSLFERFGAFFFGGDFSPIGDPRLEPERSIAVDGGIDQTFLRGRARVSATYFYTRLQNIINFGSLPPNDPFGRFFGGYLHLGGGLARGVELSAEISSTPSTS